MRVAILFFAAGMLIQLGACGAEPSPAPVPVEPEAPEAVTAPVGGAPFNAAAWSEVVNASPCDWLSGDTVSALVGPGAVGSPEVSRSETACVWRDAEGALVFTAAVVSFDSAANLSAERQAQLDEAQGGQRFRRLDPAGGVVTPILRTDRIKLMMFPNSEDESAVIVLSGHPVLGDPETVRAEKMRRAEAFALELMRVHGL
jgi:hypothetical protein